MRLCLLFLFSLAIPLLSDCGRDLSTAAGTVEEFVDLHYVDMNLSKARQHCIGLALKKIDEEIRLTQGQPVDASTRKPSVYYKLLEKRQGPASVSFLYQGTVRPADASVFVKRWLITARPINGVWKISNFADFD